MSVIRHLFLSCDGPDCPQGIEPDVAETAAELRAEARRHGWVHRKGRDLCENCAATDEGHASRTPR